MNLQSIADAIAGRFTGLSVTIDGQAEALTAATADIPNQLGAGPTLLVYPPQGDLRIGAPGHSRDDWTFTVMMLRDPIDYPGRTRALYTWFNALRYRVEGNYDLDLAYVAWAETRGQARLELDGEAFANMEGRLALYDVVELTVAVRVEEIITGLSI